MLILLILILCFLYYFSFLLLIYFSLYSSSAFLVLYLLGSVLIYLSLTFDLLFFLFYSLSSFFFLFSLFLLFITRIDYVKVPLGSLISGFRYSWINVLNLLFSIYLYLSRLLHALIVLLGLTGIILILNLLPYYLLSFSIYFYPSCRIVSR